MLCLYKSGQCVNCGNTDTSLVECLATSSLEEKAYPAIDNLPSDWLSPTVEQLPSRESPGFIEKLKNFATAAAGHVAAGMPMASNEEIIRRHDICLGCEHLQNDACNLCGCPVARVRGYVSKLSWADSECPIGKWGKATKNSIDP